MKYPIKILQIFSMLKQYVDFSFFNHHIFICTYLPILHKSTQKVSILQIGNTIPKKDIEKKEKYWNRNQASIVPRAKLMIFTTFSLHHFLVFVLEPASIIMFAFHFVQNYGIFNHGHKNTKCTTESPNFDHSNTSILRSSMLDSSICVHHDQIQCYQKTHASRDLKISVIKYCLVKIENNRS